MAHRYQEPEPTRRRRRLVVRGNRGGLLSQHVAVRTCVACRTRAPKAALLRLVARDGVAVADPTQTEPGRGAYICADCGHPSLAGVKRALRKNDLERISMEGSWK